MLTATADPDADLEHSLVEWRTYRRSKRLAEIHWIDALYRAYLTALVGGTATLIAASLIGDGQATADQVARVAKDAPDWLGVVAAVVFALGLRSGSRGGPLALERAEVRHVLLAPVDRTTALRMPAIRQVRFMLFVAAIVGGIGGVLADHRLPGNSLEWVLCGVAFTTVTVAIGYGTALCASGWRVPSWLGTMLGGAVVVWALLDAGNMTEGSPFAAVGRLAVKPLLSFEPINLLGPVVAFALVVMGMRLVGNTSVEAAERRSSLVGQLRFAATLQDVRTVIVLRRQLAMELPRLEPWVNIRVRGTGRFPVWARGVRGALRWPAARVARLVLLAVVAGVCLRLAWSGTTPLVLVAGIALFIAGLDAVEPMAQEADHPSRRDSVPVESGALAVRHLPVSIVVMLLVALTGALAGFLVSPSANAAEVALLCVVPAAACAVGGGAVSVLSGAPSQGDSWSVMPPEVAGMRLLVRSAWPPGLAVIGALPVFAARAAYENDIEMAGPTAAAAGAVLLVALVVFGWIRVRDRVHQWWRAQMDMAFPQPASRPGEEEGDGEDEG